MTIYKMTRGPDGRMRVAAIDPDFDRPDPKAEAMARLEEKARVREAPARVLEKARAAEQKEQEQSAAPTPPASGSYQCEHCSFVATTLPGLKSHQRARHGS